jgi:hypothetical protein
MLGKFKAFGYDYDVGFFIDEETFFILFQIISHLAPKRFLQEQGECNVHEE